MTCRRAFELELPAFLADPRAPGFADFRDHYPRCAACAAEVRAWTELAARLASAAPAHPEPEQLLRYADRDAALTAAERGAVEAHLARCAACRDELAALAAFEPAALAAPAAPRARTGLAGTLAALRRLLWQPALAWAVALLLALPMIYTLMRQGAPVPAPLIAAAERDAVPAADAPPAPPEPGRPAAKDAAALRAVASEGVEEPSARPETFALRARESASDAGEGAARRALALSVAAGPPALRFEARGGGLAALRVPVPADAGAVEVRLVAPDGRSLDQRFAPTAGEVELLVAESWLGAGTHRVEVRAGDAMVTHTAERP